MTRPECAVRMLDHDHGAAGNFDWYCDCGRSSSIATLDPMVAMAGAARHLAATVQPTVDELAELLAVLQ